MLRRFVKRIKSLSWRQRLAVAAFVAASLLIFIPIATYAYFVKDLGSKESIMNRNNTGVTLLDRNDRPFYTFYEAEAESFMSIDKIPEHLKQAVVAAEDKEFYDHPGFSIKAIGSALYADLRRSELKYGGSTITQQLVKNTLLTKKKSFLRKYQEIILSAEIDKRFGKDEILEMYLNSVYLGEGAFGVEAAAKAYFNKSASELTLAESTLLVGILPAPSVLSPVSGDLAEAQNNQRIVLGHMQDQQYITEEQRQQVESQQLSFKQGGNGENLQAPHFALMVRDELIERYGEERIARSGFKVKTGLDLDWQAAAEAALAKQMQALRASNVANGAVVVQDPKTGEIRALVGSRDWNQPDYGKVNMAISPRQPGSSYKPLYYVAALDKKIITPATVLHDKATTFSDGYRPQNFDFRYRGDVLTRRALGNSLNIPAVEVMNKLGVAEALEMSKNLGLTTLGDDDGKYGLSLGLGSGEVKLTEMTAAYSILANQGQKFPTTLVSSIRNKQGGHFYQYRPEAKRVLAPEAPYLISSILSDPNARRETFGSRLDITRTAAVKTGSTEDYRDAWTLGYSPSLAIGVWIGNNDHSPMTNVAGSFGAAPVWRSLMEQFLPSSPKEEFAMPSGITSRQVCSSNGLWAKQASGGTHNEHFMKGTEPGQSCQEEKREQRRDDGDRDRDEEPQREEPRDRGRRDRSDEGNGDSGD